ncbi:MAG TPA: YggS family pyridoxal phosphate-dependent enzyme [Acidobacteriota bacterium]|nr:YggS family pyridoxal phosphate-dependent enzyme [Acidobacteriota bacterium]
MRNDGDTLRPRLDDVRGRIAAAAARSGRPAGAVTLVGVTKTVPAVIVQEAVAAGLVDLGENRVQEAQAKIPIVGRANVRWHFIGHLQRNKAGRAVELFDRVHSVDDAELAEALSRHAVAAGRTLPVLVEVNVSGEASKFGVAPEALGALLERMAALPGLVLDGLMTVGPLLESAAAVRPCFVRLRELRDEAERRLGRRLPELSMGMSGDFEVAVEEGSTLVRVGGAIFGPRPAPGGTGSGVA